jgi:transposase, IS30 family
MTSPRKWGWSARQSVELWERWKRGESLEVIGQALGKPASSIYLAAAAKGGIAPVMRCRAPRVLQAAEREEISRGIAAGMSMRQIALRIDRSVSTVSREIGRHGGLESYRAGVADAAAWRNARRPKACKLALERPLCGVVARKLEKNWSPRQISEWLKCTFPDDQSMQISHESIYRTLFVQARGALKKELLSHLRRAGLIRRGRKPADAGNKQGQIKDAISIRQRPAEAEDRAVPGHWEGDLLMGGRSSQIATLVERSTRFVMLVKIGQKDSPSVANALAQKIRRLPAELKRSLTWDRGTEMAAHKQFTVASDVKVYFCDPRSPWQRGSNENTNGLLRQYFPKGDDLSVYSQSHLNKVATQLNGRPRETLGWQNPAAAFNSLVASTG